LSKTGEAGDEFAAAMAKKLDRMNAQKQATGSMNQKDIDQICTYVWYFGPKAV